MRTTKNGAQNGDNEAISHKVALALSKSQTEEPAEPKRRGRKPKSDAVLREIARAESVTDVEPAKPKVVVAVKIPQLKIARMTLTIRGLAPYLAHGWSEKSRRMMADKQQGEAVNKKAPRVPKEEFEAAKIRDPQSGKEAVPSLHIKCAMASASTFVDGMSRKEILGAIFVEGEYLALTYEKCVMREDVTRVGSGMNKTATLAYRPEYHGWSVKVPIRFLENIVSASEVVNLLNLAGMCIGLGDWRIEKKGVHGAFEVVI